MHSTSKKKLCGSSGFLQELKKLKSQQKYLETFRGIHQGLSAVNSEQCVWDKAKAEENSNEMICAKNIKWDVKYVIALINYFSERVLNKHNLAQYKLKQYRTQVYFIDQKFVDISNRNANQIQRLKQQYANFADKLMEVNGELTSFY